VISPQQFLRIFMKFDIMMQIGCRKPISYQIYEILKIHDGGHPLYWKLENCDIYTANWPSFTKFCTVMHTDPLTAVQKFKLLARDVIYTSHIYATMSVLVCLSVCLWRLCIVVTGCNGSWIPLHAWIDGCPCYLLTTPHPDRRMGWCRDFWWKRGGVISRYPGHC